MVVSQNMLLFIYFWFLMFYATDTKYILLQNVTYLSVLYLLFLSLVYFGQFHIRF